ncbi:stalk domain-containing protein [Paenibacillus sp. FSL L8-0709]|uniref:stalk domain-containing protein n=1 Tax=Paenibacillus sp. FSL L8-0709 TaxID=2975312 RepID=UPI0030F68BB4
MKAVIVVALLSVLVFPFSVSAANQSSTETSVKVFLDGKQLSFDSPPMIVNGSTLVPMRAIFGALGAEVTWNNKTQSVSAKREGLDISLRIGEKKAVKNGIAIPLATPSVIIRNSTYVPLRFVSEALGALVGWNKGSSSISISSAPYRKVVVDRTVDGDTIELNDGEKVRLIGVNTPESVQSGPIEFYGVEASNYTKAQLTGKTVYITSENKDTYGRTLGYVFLTDGTFYNALLASEGYATVMTIEPNTKWSPYFEYVQSQAKKKSVGIWSNKKEQASADMQKYFIEKSKEFGFKEGEFSSGQFITRDFVARMIVTSMFPKTKYVFAANTLIDVSQQDWFQYYVGVLLQEGVIKISDLNSGMFEPDRPITYGEYKKMISNALFGTENTDLKLADFNLLQENISDSQLMTMGEALIATEKASNVFVPLSKYYASLKEAAANSNALEALTQKINDVDINSKVSSLKKEFNKKNFESIQQKSSDIFQDFLELLKKGSWKDIITISKIKALISDIESDLVDASEHLKEAKAASNLN